MDQKEKLESLLDALLRYFEDFNAQTPYYETSADGKRYVPVIQGDNRSILAFWELLFCREIRALSIAPRSRSKSLNKDALGALRRNVINDKSKSIIQRNLIPHFSNSRGPEVMEAQKNHLLDIIERSIRAKYSKKTKDPRRPEDHFIWEYDLKKKEEITVYLYRLIDLLRESFEGEPASLLDKRYHWFYQMIAQAIEEGIEDDVSEERFFAILSAALVLSLNFVQNPGVNERIQEFLMRYLVPRENREGGGIKPQRREIKKNDDEQALYKSAIFVKRRFGRDVDKGLVEELETIIYALILEITKEVWSSYSLSQKVQVILDEYQEVMELDQELSRDIDR